MSEAAAKDMTSLREYIANPSHTLIVARHGTEWWAGYFLHTPVRMGVVPDDAFTKYERVLMLVDSRGGMRPGGFGGPGGQPRLRQRDDGDADADFAPEFDGPPPDDFDDGGGPSDGPRRRFGPGGPGGGPQMETRLPENAKLIAKTDSYSLYEVPRPEVAQK